MGVDTYLYRDKLQEPIAHYRGGWPYAEALGVEESSENPRSVTITNSPEILDRIKKYLQERLVVVMKIAREEHLESTILGENHMERTPHILTHWHFERMFLEDIHDALIKYGKVDISIDY